jgi:hypothetical protein
MVSASSAIIQDIDDMRKSRPAALVFFYCDFREEKRGTCAGYSHHYWSNFVINPTRAAISFPSSSQNTKMVRNMRVMPCLSDV